MIIIRGIPKWTLQDHLITMLVNYKAIWLQGRISNYYLSDICTYEWTCWFVLAAVSYFSDQSLALIFEEFRDHLFFLTSKLKRHSQRPVLFKLSDQKKQLTATSSRLRSEFWKKKQLTSIIFFEKEHQITFFFLEIREIDRTWLFNVSSQKKQILQECEWAEFWQKSSWLLIEKENRITMSFFWWFSRSWWNLTGRHRYVFNSFIM